MDAPKSLCPGYTQVDAFGPDDEYEDEEEIVYVTLDMGNVEPTLVPSSTSYRLIGLDTPTPFLQLQGTILKGRHDLLLGTELIFTDDKESHDWNKRSVVHVANTEQRIAFQEVTLIPKGSSSTSVSAPTPSAQTPAATPSTSTAKAKASAKSKGKQKAVPTPPAPITASSSMDTSTSTTSQMPAPSDLKVSFEPPTPTPDELDAAIDRLSGVTGPIPRAGRARSRKGSATPQAQTPAKEKGKGKERARSTKATRTSTRTKGKGKQKEADTEPEETEAAHEDQGDEDADAECVDDPDLPQGSGAANGFGAIEDVSMGDVDTSEQPPRDEAQAEAPPPTDVAGEGGTDNMHVDE